MTNRNVTKLVTYSILTIGIYALKWEIESCDEMNAQGANIPTAWYLIVPGLNFIWLWKFAQGVGKVTNGSMTASKALLVLWLLNVFGVGMIQAEFNKVGTGLPKVLQ